MSLPVSSSEAPDPFLSLHPKVQQWIWHQNWRELRPIQVAAIKHIMGSDADIILAAATAAGKTEAAFLPILSRVADVEDQGFSVVYVSPLKALINDQFRRLETLCEALDLPVTKWHGDASQTAKAKALKDPRGVVLITPESIEALLVRRGPEVRRLLHATKFIVIDELHAFQVGERGVHLASLLKRLEAQAARKLRKIGLSATIGDYASARYFLSPTAPDAVTIVNPASSESELRLQVRGYRDHEYFAQDAPEEEEAEAESTAFRDILNHLHQTLRGSNNLAFAGRRQMVEAYADGLASLCEAQNQPNEFFPHHGSLSKSLREELEERLKESTLPTTAVATTTLELGIDVGSVTSVAQIGPPSSISGLRQRVGRSGRREGQSSVLRVYVSEPDKPDRENLFSCMRSGVVQAVAAVHLLLRGFLERGSNAGTHLSTLLHQTLAVIQERGGVKAEDLYRLLCGPGPFSGVSPADYVHLLRSMGTRVPALVEQGSDGLLMLGPVGEQLTGRYDFYAVFMSDEEYRIVTADRALGTLPISHPLKAGDYLTFAGRRWIVELVDDSAKVIRVAKAPAGRLPRFEGGDAAPLDDKLLAEMRAVYRASERPSFVDAVGHSLLQEAREMYAELALDTQNIVQEGDDTFVFLWLGTRGIHTWKLALSWAGIETLPDPLGLHAPRKSAAEVLDAIKRIAAARPTADTLAARVETLHLQKYDGFVPDEMLRRAFAQGRVDMTAIDIVLDQN